MHNVTNNKNDKICRQMLIHVSLASVLLEVVLLYPAEIQIHWQNRNSLSLHIPIKLKIISM